MDPRDPRMLYSIGEFSRITGLTVKALRFYHDEGLLPPAVIDADSGYRYYTPEQAELARAIRLLRDLEFPVRDIQTILAGRADGQRVTEALIRQKAALEEQIKKHRQAVHLLQDFIAAERQSERMVTPSQDVQEKTLDPVLVAGIRMKGRYDECGKLFGQLFRGARSATAGSPMLLHYDMEYKENDADFEACLPLKQQKPISGASVRQLPGGRCVTLIHKGPYNQLSTSYERILRYIKEKGYRIASPSREVYLKGPGMIFRGNPKNYVTEIQMLIEPAA